jgi:anti-anti-sigma factor
MASLATGVIVLLTLIALAPLFSDLPEPILAAVIIEAVVTGMMDFAEMRRLLRVKRSDFWIAIAAILGVLTFGVLAGVVIGVALSVGWLVYVNATPAMPVLGREAGTHVFRDLGAHPEDERTPGVLVVRLEGGLFFVTAAALDDRIRQLDLSADPPLTAVVLDCMSVNFVDSQGSAEVAKLVDAAKAHGISFRLARVKPAVRELLARDGVIDQLGADHIHDDVEGAVQAELALRSSSG